MKLKELLPLIKYASAINLYDVKTGDYIWYSDDEIKEEPVNQLAKVSKYLNKDVVNIYDSDVCIGLSIDIQ